MFPERIKELRLSKKLTQQDMANKLGITRPAYTAYERGKREPDFSILRSIASILSVTTDYLLGRNNTSEWTAKDVVQLDKILQSNAIITYGEEIVTLEDREIIDNLIAGYFWSKKQKRKKQDKED